MSRDWVRMRSQDRRDVESMLRGRERYCVSACAKFLGTDPKPDVWLYKDERKRILSVIVKSGQGLYPVLCGEDDIPAAFFLHAYDTGFHPALHSLQAVTAEALLVALSIQRCGPQPSENIDYDLMEMDEIPPPRTLQGGSDGLILRIPDKDTNWGDLSALEAAYMREEVMTSGSYLDPAVVNRALQRIFHTGQILTAEIGGRMVGKINTNAESFTRFQLGGVYVIPEYRCRGIAGRMTAEFVRRLIIQGKSVNLFVKKTNGAAMSVYRRLGFRFVSDYRISYY